MWWWHDGYWGGPFGGLLMAVMMVAFWGLVIWLILGLVRSSTSRPRSGSAKDILDRRFASGEIDEDEYRSRLAALTSARGDEPSGAERG